QCSPRRARRRSELAVSPSNAGFWTRERRWNTLQDWNLPELPAVFRPTQIPPIPCETWTGPVAETPVPGQRDQGWTEKKFGLEIEIQSQLRASLSAASLIVKKVPA